MKQKQPHALSQDGQKLPVSISARLGKLQFHKSGKFRVLQLADIQDGPTVSKDTISLIAAACDAARPDVVIFTGDQIAGYDPAFSRTHRKRRWPTKWDGIYRTSQAVGKEVNALVEGVMSHSGLSSQSPDVSENEHDDKELALDETREMVRRQAAQFLAPLIERGIPFAITYGNHDFQCGLETSDLDAIYREFPGCLNPEDSGTLSTRSKKVPASGLDSQEAYVCEPGTFALPVSDEDGKNTAIGLVLVDSGDYAPEGGYGVPSTKAIEWLKRIPSHLHAKSIVFQHIPVPQFYDLLRPVPPTTAYAIAGYRTYSNQCYVIDEDKCEPGGYLGEGISCPDTDAGEVDAMKQSQGYFALFASHDHRNAFVGKADGLLFGATPTCGFGSYGPPAAHRAGRLIEFDIRHPYQPRTQLLEYGTLVGGRASHSAYTFAMSHLPKGPADAVNLLRKPGVMTSMFAAVAGVGAVLSSFLRNRKH